MNNFKYNTRRNAKFSFIVTVILLVLSGSFSVAETSTIETVVAENKIAEKAETKSESLEPTKEVIAIGGFDVAAYHLEGKAILGKGDYTYVWKGQTWLFSSETNKNEFEKAPDKYAPEYNGCCAYALSEGRIEKGDPEVFRINDGKLYFFHDENRRARFEKDISRSFEKANKNYVKLFSIKF
ncbi:YHS domain-containing protein [Puniceicoccaceae bacterium K14]|nr:YHS domain-containing protein [Puniceicoccaceae bacterium K14]